MSLNLSWDNWHSVAEGLSVPGAPVAAVPFGNLTALFIADPDGGVYAIAGYPEQPHWGDWGIVGSRFTRPGAALTALPLGSRCALFMADTNGEVFSVVGVPDNRWDNLNWLTVAQGSSTPGAPIAAVPFGNRTALFLADPSGGVYTIAGDPEQARWPGWAIVGTRRTTPGAPITAVPVQKGIALFMTDVSGEVVSIAGDPDRGFAGDWTSVAQGRSVQGAPVAAYFDPPTGNVVLFITDPQGEAYFIVGDPERRTFGAWQQVKPRASVPGTRVAAVRLWDARTRNANPSAFPFGDTRFLLFKTDNNGEVFVSIGSVPRNTWAAWISVRQGSSIPGAPIAVSINRGRFSLFLADPGGGIFATSGSIDPREFVPQGSAENLSGSSASSQITVQWNYAGPDGDEVAFEVSATSSSGAAVFPQPPIVSQPNQLGQFEVVIAGVPMHDSINVLVQAVNAFGAGWSGGVNVRT